MKNFFDLRVFKHPTLKKLIMEVKIAFLIIVLSVSNLLATDTYSQVAKVTLDLENKSLERVMDEIERQSEFYFIFNQKQIDVHRVVDIQADNKLITDILPELFKGTNVNYAVFDRKILLTTDHMDNSLLAIAPITKLQQVTVRGTVTDLNTGEALPGVNVVVQGTTFGAVTDVNGDYILNVPNASVTLQFSFIGYINQNIALQGRTTLDVNLVSDITQLEEVVVIGYGTLKKRDLTGSVSTINMNSIERLPVTGIGQKLIGQSAGIHIQQISGFPGAGTSVRIRGMGSLGAGNDPLYVVDGMPYSSGFTRNLDVLSYINPDDIESISILKDASSTAIYGSRGSNGVIIITTKKGNYNQTEINVSSMTGVQEVPKSWRPRMMNQREFAEYQQDIISLKIRARENREATLDDFPEIFRYPEQMVGDGTDWLDLILHPGVIQDHKISVLKGSKDSRINFSLGYYDQEGVLRYTGFSRFTSKLTMESNIGKSVTIGGSLQPSYITQDRADTDRHGSDIINSALQLNPAAQAYDENGKLIQYIQAPINKYVTVNSHPNPLFRLRETPRTTKEFQNLGLVYIEWAIVPDLKIKSSLNIINSHSRYFTYTPSYVGGENNPPKPTSTGSSSTQENTSINWLSENTLTYNKTFTDHRVDALLGYTIQKYSSKGINLTARPYPNDLIRTINAAQAISGWGESMEEWSMISYISRINYSFKERYFLTGTIRSDGSSRFGIKNRYGTFPSIAVSWRVSEEEFFENNKVIDDLKLRISYGKSGNNNIGNYGHLALISSGAYVFDNKQVTGSFAGLANPYLTWEESNQFDVGFDFSIFKNRLSLVADFYDRKSVNMLMNDVIPAITGFSTQIVNKGNVRNRGLEITLDGVPVSGKFGWDINMNIAFNRNKVIATNDKNDRILSGGSQWVAPTHVTEIGKPIGQFFGFEVIGLLTAEDMDDPNVAKDMLAHEGGLKYKDVNNDGKITDLDDCVILGNPHHDFIYGLTNNFTYKNLSLSIIMNGQYGGEIVDFANQMINFTWGRTNLRKEYVNRWRSAENPGDGIHSGPSTDVENWTWKMNSQWVEDATYLRISNVTLGYSVPESWTKQTRFIKNCQFYLSVQNLATFKYYRGFNPEGQSVNKSTTLEPGFDAASYPLARTVSFGVKLAF